MNTRIIASVIFTAILASSAAQASPSVSGKRSVDDNAKAYLLAAEEIQKQYAGYSLDITREALIRLSAYHYPEFAAQQSQFAQNDFDKAYLTATEETPKQFGYGVDSASERDAD